MATLTSALLREITNVSGRVDRVSGIIRGVKILGIKSRNRREYTPQALRDAAPKYEGIAVNIDHENMNNQRSYRDRIGRLEHVQARADGLYGDLQFNMGHPMAEQLAWDAEHSPSAVGLSHDAMGKTTQRNGITVVEEIKSVRSVDLVADPATTRGLFESTSTQPRCLWGGESLQQIGERFLRSTHGHSTPPTSSEYGGIQEWTEGGTRPSQITRLERLVSGWKNNVDDNRVIEADTASTLCAMSARKQSRWVRICAVVLGSMLIWFGAIDKYERESECSDCEEWVISIGCRLVST